jgi:tetratricopeptide (TPR) repeat protein
MRDILEAGQWLIIALIGIIVVLLGLHPLPLRLSIDQETTDQTSKAGDYQTRIADLVRIAEQQPWRSGLWESAGHIALSDGDVQGASDYFARSAAKGQLSREGYLAWGDADWKAGNFQTALQIWEIALGLGASPEEILIRKAEAYRALDDDLALIETLQEILRQSSADDQSRSELGLINYELGLLLMAYKPASAVSYLSSAADYDPILEPKINNLIYDIQRGLSKENHAYLLMVSGRSLARIESWNLAERAFQNAVDQQPNYAEAWAYLGEANQHTSSGIDPMPSLTTALEIDPESISANIFMGFYLKRNGQPEAALVYLEKASEIDPKNPAYLVEIGTLMALSGDLESGKEYFIRAIELSSFDPKYVREFLKFSMQYNLDLRSVALPVARQLVLQYPKDPASLNLMGELLVRLGDMQNAERFFLRALSEDSIHDQTHLLLGQFYLGQGNFEAAEFHFYQVLEVSENQRIILIAQQALDLISHP